MKCLSCNKHIDNEKTKNKRNDICSLLECYYGDGLEIKKFQSFRNDSTINLTNTETNKSKMIEFLDSDEFYESMRNYKQSSGNAGIEAFEYVKDIILQINND